MQYEKRRVKRGVVFTEKLSRSAQQPQGTSRAMQMAKKFGLEFLPPSGAASDHSEPRLGSFSDLFRPDDQ